MLRTRRIVSVALVLVVVAGSAAAAAASRSTPSASARAYGTNNTKYVASATYDVLGRYATDEDYARWAGPLDSGLTHTEFAKSIVKRPERAAIVITQLYNDAFLRDPDAAGLAYWTAKLTAGYRSANLAAALYASNEFYEGTGGEVEPYVKIIYLSLLQRQADEEGLAYWTKRIEGGAPRSTITRSFYLSRESNARRVRAIYGHLLGRAPSATSLKDWSRAFVVQDDNALIARIVASDEYYLWTQGRVYIGPTSSTTTKPKPGGPTTPTSSTTTTPRGSTSSTSSSTSTTETTTTVFNPRETTTTVH